MLTKGMRKKEIEEVLEGKGEFVKIDYLNRYLKLMPPIEMRKFAYLKLAQVYLNKGMFTEAAKMYKNISINSLIFREKRENYLRESKAYILAGKFEESDKALKRAMGEGNSREKTECHKTIIDFYKKEAEEMGKQKKPGSQMKIYEKLIRMRISDSEKEEVKEKLLKIYDKLGKRKEYNFLKSLRE